MRQLMKFISILVECLPEMAAEIMQGWIENPSGLKKVLKQALCPPEESPVSFCSWKAVIKYIIDLDADPLVPDGWKVEEHIKGGQFEFDPAKVLLHLEEEQQNGSIVGTKLRKKLEKKSRYNANLLDFYLAHPNLIPEEWKGRAVFFWGTIYRGPDGRLCVRYLFRSEGRWQWRSYWLDYGFYDDRPAAVSASN